MAWKAWLGIIQSRWKWHCSMNSSHISYVNLSCKNSTVLSCTIFELFDIEEYSDFKIYVKSHSWLLEIAPFNKSHAIFYWRSIIMILYCIVSDIMQYIGRKLLRKCHFHPNVSLQCWPRRGTFCRCRRLTNCLERKRLLCRCWNWRLCMSLK